jgi:hypothetical protein
MSEYPIRQPMPVNDRPVDLTKPGNAPENAPIQDAQPGATPAGE